MMTVTKVSICVHKHFYLHINVYVVLLSIVQNAYLKALKFKLQSLKTAGIE